MLWFHLVACMEEPSEKTSNPNGIEESTEEVQNH